MASESDFEEFFATRALRLRRVAFVVVGDWSAAEDVVQAALVKVYAAWHRIDLRTADPYARRAVVNTALTHRRRRRRETPLEPDHDGAISPSDHSTDAVMRELARLLPVRQRAVLALRFLDDLSVAETAAALGISEGAVKSQSSRALAKLRAIYGQDEERILW